MAQKAIVFRFIAMVGVLMGGFSFAQSIVLESGGEGDAFVEATDGSVLFSTFSGVPASPWTITCQQFTVTGGMTGLPAGFATVGADDFTIAVGQRAWLINSVEVSGSYFYLSGPAESVNVYILGDAAGLPDTTNLSAGAIYAYENASFTDVGTGDFHVDFPGGGVLLLEGTYWLVVQPNMDVFVGGQWGWTESSSAPDTGGIVGNESAWFQTDPLFSGACVGAWGPRITTCNITRPPNGTLNEHDLAFNVVGTQLVAGVTVNPTANVNTTEAGGSSVFDVVLDAPPLGGNTVSIDVTSGDVTEVQVNGGAMTTLVFSAANWDIPQTITLSGVDDAIADGNVGFTITLDPVVSADPGYAGIDPADVTGVNFDDESAGITVSPLMVTLAEAGPTMAFTVAANTPPTDNVTVPLTSGDPTEFSIPASVVLPSGSTAPVMVTVTPIDDDIDDGDVVAAAITGDPTSAGDAVYDALGAADVIDPMITVTDDDTAGITVTPGAPEPMQTDETGLTANFTVVLDSEPTGNVTVDLYSSDLSEANLSMASLVFTNANWDTPQGVTVTGLDDFIDDGTVSYLAVTVPAVSSDPSYDGYDAADVACENLDDADTAGFTVNPVAGLVTYEDPLGPSDTFDVALDSEPTSDVTLPISSSNLLEGMPDVAMLVFTPGNWNVNQTVTVTGVDDALADGDQPYTIITGDPTSNDPLYNAFTAVQVADVDVINIDDEIACGPVTIDVVIGGAITVTGTPGCVFDLYSSNCSSDTGTWVLLAAGVVIPAGGVVVVPGVVGAADVCYVVTQTGTFTILGQTITVPTLSQWMLGILILSMLAGAFWVRRKLS